MNMYNEANSLDLEDIVDDSLDNDVTSELSDESDLSSDINETDDSINNSETDFDLIKELLIRQGISDMNKIKFEDESGAVVEKSWDSLIDNEKLMILSHQEDPDTSLDASEIELINQIRESGMSPDQFIQSLQTQPEKPVVYEVDSMTDDELFCIDLLDKIGSDNISDEELQQALELAKSNETLYNKQVASLRTYYKGLEQERIEKEAEEKQAAAEQEYTNFSNSIIESIRDFNRLEDIPVELSQDEMEDLANYILTRDASGYSEFGHVLNDPAQFIKAAFWMLKGPAILNEMQNQIKEAYLRGYNETHKQERTKVITKPSIDKHNNNESQFASFDEDSYLK